MNASWHHTARSDGGAVEGWTAGDVGGVHDRKTSEVWNLALAELCYRLGYIKTFIAR
jgi:hypothetical protein